MQPLQIALRGITNDSTDPSVDIWRTVTFPLLRSMIGIDAEDDMQLKVIKRGCPPAVSSQCWPKKCTKCK